MTPLKIKLKSKDLSILKELLKYEEPRVIRRANILNCLHLGYGPVEIAAILNVDRRTVTNVAAAYTELGLDAALHDDERSGRPIDFDDREKSRIIAMVCTNPPDGSYRWTLDLIAEEAEKRDLIHRGISREQVRIILQEHDLKPWLEKMWCIGELNKEYIQKMEDVLDVYERPYNEKRPVVCIDEKPVPLIGDTRERILPENPGDMLKKDYEYERNGSVNVFCAVEPKAGKYINTVTEKRCASDFAKFIKSISDTYSNAEKIILVMDNLATHKEKHLTDYYGEQEGKKLWNKFEVHYTPKHGSWLNMAEIELSHLSRQCLNRRIADKSTFIHEIAEWNKNRDAEEATIDWQFTTEDARIKLKRLYPVLQPTGQIQ